MDLSGKILFKVKLNDQIKKLMIHNDELNYNDLTLMLQRIFSDKIKQNDEFSIKYTDEENDLVTIEDDADVALAVQTSKILKLTIFMKDDSAEVGELKPSEIVSELKHIRESIDKFLTSFEKSIKLEHKIDQITKATDEIKVEQVNHQVNPEVQKEFDPLSKKEAFAQNIQKQSRAQTPDSVCSNEMTGRASPRVHPSYQPPMVHPQHQAPMQQQQQAPTQHVPQHANYAPSAPSQQQIAPNQQQHQQPSHPGTAQNPALKPPSQMPSYFPQQGYMPQGMPQAQMHQQNVSLESQQQYFQHQQQQQQFSQPPGGLQNQAPAGYNPYSKNPNMSLARPPSTTIYQQGYK